MEIGVSTSICRAEDFDLGETIDFAVEAGLPVVQLFLNTDAVKHASCLGEITVPCRQRGIRVITHLDILPSKKTIGSRVVAHRIALGRQKSKIAVAHFEQERTQDLLDLVRAFAKEGMTVAVENRHRSLKIPGEREKHNAFLRFFRFYAKSNPLMAVLDWAQYFIAKNSEEMLPAEETTQIIAEDFGKLRNYGAEVFFHSIGSNGFCQARKNFTAPGAADDIIPQREIITAIKKIDPECRGPIILEVESPEDATAGIRNLQKILADLG